MHTIRYRGCVAQQDNKTMEVIVNKPGHPEKRYHDYTKRLSAKELRTTVMRYLVDIGER